MSPQVWFITGASSGFGRAVTERVLKSGDNVVATLRNPSVLSDLTKVYPESRLLVVELDVTDNAAIQGAFAKAVDAFGRIDVVFNNAGYGLFGVAEAVPDDIARAQFEVNFWGPVNITKEAVRVSRDVNSPPGGRILQNSSMTVFGGKAALSYYAATKTAIEGFSQSIASELDPEWDIKVTIIEPGSFRTDSLTRSMVILDPPPIYARDNSPVTKLLQYFQSNPELLGDTEKAAVVIHKIAALPQPPLHFPLGKDSIANAKGHIGRLLKEVEEYESWSGDLAV